MFDRIFANYLVETGKLSEQNVEVIFSTKEERRARLGVIAVSEKVLTVDQAEEINQLQAIYDKRFGDIAIDNGYLTEEQVERLLNLQGNAFLAFIQSIVDHGCLTMDEIDESLATYQKKNSLTNSDMENLKSCEIDDIVPIFLFKQPELLIDLCGIFVRSIYRLVDYRVYIKKPYVATEVPYPYLGMQELYGEHNILTAIVGDADTLKQAAIGFAGAEYINDEADSLDALCELINCINGMFATKMSHDGMELDMKVPEYALEPGTFRGALLCIPVIVYDKEFTVIFSIDNEFSK
ncbi:MAG: chemotaxis protein CheX [Ruminococcus sp.]|nr:chemotaxis protein CheX [Ruminococcus sp.]